MRELQLIIFVFVSYDIERRCRLPTMCRANVFLSADELKIMEVFQSQMSYDWLIYTYYL